MSMPIAFVDCETTHLDAEIGHAWEVAIVLREFEDGQHTDTEYAWQIRPNLAKADPEAVRIGRYEERFAVPDGAEAAWTAEESGHVAEMTRREAITAIVNVLSGAVLVGSNPGFDDRHLRRLVGRGRAKWHYRPYDIVQLAAAKIGAQQAGPLPWSSYALSRAVGVEPPAEDVAHTALGDARWARDVYDAATRRQPYEMTVEGRAQHAMGLYVQTAIELEDAQRDLREMRGNYDRACRTVAAMHKAAVGDVRGPARGVVEDVEDVRQRADQIMKALHIYSHILRQRPGRQFTTEYIRKQVDALIEHPQDVCDLDDREARIERVRQILDGLCAEPHGSHDHVCPDDVRRAVTDALDGPSQPVSPGETVCTCTFAEACGCGTSALYDDLGDDEPEDDEETDADSDVFELIAEIASRLRDATDEGEYQAVGLIYDLAETHKTVDEARAELAEITFRHV